jgi:hypothetical protein
MFTSISVAARWMGVAFNYINYDGERRINFLSGKVEALGISAIGTALDGYERAGFDAGLLESLLKKCSKRLREGYEYRVRCLVGHVVMTAKRKDGRDWQVDGIQNSDYERRRGNVAFSLVVGGSHE